MILPENPCEFSARVFMTFLVLWRSLIYWVNMAHLKMSIALKAILICKVNWPRRGFAFELFKKREKQLSLLIKNVNCTKENWNKSTGCPGSKFPNWKSYYSESMHVRPQVGKAKMCLRNIHFCLHLELFVYKKFKNMKYEHYFQHCFHGLVG